MALVLFSLGENERGALPQETVAVSTSISTPFSFCIVESMLTPLGHLREALTRFLKHFIAVAIQMQLAAV